MSDQKIKESIEGIIEKNRSFGIFWGNLDKLSGRVDGWAPNCTAQELLSNVCFESQLSLSYRLRELCRSHPKEEDVAKLILMHTALGSLLESTLKFFITVYIFNISEKNKKIGTKNLHQIEKILKENRIFEQEQLQWIKSMRESRNSIHSFNKQNIDEWNKLKLNISKYNVFLDEIDTRLPWPS